MNKGSALDMLHRAAPETGSGSGSYFVPPVVLRVEGLIKIYGKRRVVDGVSFHVNRGEIVGLLGPNGAGKTTSFRMTCGLINTNGGIVYLGAQDVTNWPMYRRSREGGMGYLPQDKSVFQKLSVQNNLLGVMEMIGMKRNQRKRRCDELLEKFGLTHLRRNPAGGLSGGERRRLEIARSLVSDPKIILLDEPFAAVDPITVTSIQTIIRQLADEGISILITDHSVQDTLQITERSYVIQAGKVLCHGTPAEVLGNPEARKVYFGENVSVGQIQSTIHHPARSAPIDDSAGIPESTAHRTQTTSQTFRASAETPSISVHSSEISSVAVPGKHPDDEVPERINEVRPNHREKSLKKQHVAQPAVHQRTDPSVSTSNVGAKRTVGKRLTPSAIIPPPQRPIVSSHSSADPKNDPPVLTRANNSSPQPPDQPAPANSGIIRTLGTLIWGK